MHGSTIYYCHICQALRESKRSLAESPKKIKAFIKRYTTKEDRCTAFIFLKRLSTAFLTVYLLTELSTSCFCLSGRTKFTAVFPHTTVTSLYLRRHSPRVVWAGLIVRFWGNPAITALFEPTGHFSKIHCLSGVAARCHLSLHACNRSLFSRGLSIDFRAYVISQQACWPIRTPRPICGNQDAWVVITPFDW